jgi:hypothetical protein
MEFEEFVSGISFRYIQPYSRLPLGYNHISNFLEKYFNFSIEAANTIFPENDHEIKSTLYNLQNIPRLSTLTIGAIINCAVNHLPRDQSFVNVGVWHGFSFFAGLINNPEKICIGVDNFSELGGPRKELLERFNKMKSQAHFFYDMDYQKYFSEIQKGQIGFYFYDGEHHYNNQLKGLQIAEPFLAEGAIVLIDDTNWHDPYQATLDFMQQSEYKYHVILDQKTYNNMNPTFWNGILLLRKGREKSINL